MTTAQRAHSSRSANCTLIARKINNGGEASKLHVRNSGPELGGSFWSG
jgi:hypothetical protein